MKRIFALTLSLLLIFALAACGGEKGDNSSLIEPGDDATLAEILEYDFQMRVSDGETGLTALAEGLLDNDAINFDGVTMPVEPGLLMGFGNTEITGFDEGVQFGPLISTTPFIGYLFHLDGSVDDDDFMETLEANADLRWNICTSADEMVSSEKSDIVLFVMAPLHAGE